MTIKAHYRENIIEAEKIKSGVKILNAKKIFWKSNVDCVCKDFSKQNNSRIGSFENQKTKMKLTYGSTFKLSN